MATTRLDGEALATPLGELGAALAVIAPDGTVPVLGMACHLIDARTGRGEVIDAATVEQIRRQVARLARLINQILDVSRARDRRLELAMERVDLAEIAVAAVAQVGPARAGDVR